MTVPPIQQPVFTMGLGFLYHQKFLSRLALKIVVMALGKRQEARGKRQEARGFGRFYFSLHITLREAASRLRFFSVNLLTRDKIQITYLTVLCNSLIFLMKTLCGHITLSRGLYQLMVSFAILIKVAKSGPLFHQLFPLKTGLLCLQLR